MPAPANVEKIVEAYNRQVGDERRMRQLAIANELLGASDNSEEARVALEAAILGNAQKPRLDETK